MPDLIPTDADPFSYTATPVDFDPFPQQPQQPSYPAGSTQSLLSNAASQYNLDPNLFLRQANQESGFNQRATSSAGAIGVMQLMPGTARGLGVNPYDEGQNIQGGAQYMRQMLDRYNGDYGLALAAYNAGPGRVDAYVRNGTPLPAETQHYVATILGGQGAPAYRASAAPATNPSVYGPDVAAYQQYVAAHPGGPDYVAPGQGISLGAAQPASPTVPEIDPFAAEGAAETAGNQWLGGVFGNMARGLLDIPRQAFGASNELQATAGSPQPQYNPAPVLNAAGLAMTGGFAGVPLRAGETALGAGPIRAYHGSPYDFDKFDLSKIGTGEGAQSFGHGLYFAESPGVAKSYQNALSARGNIDNVAPDATAIEKIKPEWDQIVRELSPLRDARDNLYHSGEWQFSPDYQSMDARVGELTSRLDELNAQAAQDTVERNPHLLKGRMYEVNIAADPSHFLDWDKPLSEQSPQVQQALNGLGIKPRMSAEDIAAEMKAAGWDDDTAREYAEREAYDLTGAHAYNAIGGNAPFAKEEIGKAGAAEKLRQAGIPGIKYLDQGSRRPGFSSLTPAQLDTRIKSLESDIASGGGNQELMKDKLAALQRERDTYKNLTHNYVVFDDKLIDIIKKYGLAGLIAGGAAHFSTRPVSYDPFH